MQVDPSEAPVRERVLSGAEADLTRLPALIQHELEPGPYLTAAHATTRDPGTGVDNTAIQRCWLKGPRQMTWFPYPSSHNARNLHKHWSAGRARPVAFWIGHHPAVVIGTQAKLDYPQSHWSAAGGVLGAPLRLVPTLTHGADILVPADAEIVIEGFAGPAGTRRTGLSASTPATSADLVSMIGKGLGLAGVVTDGSLRDLKGIVAVGFPVFAQPFLVPNGNLKDGPGEALGVFLSRPQDMHGQPGSGLFPDSGKLGELLNQPADWLGMLYRHR